jgi:hypothetical protein
MIAMTERSGENSGGIRESKFFNRDYLSFFATIGKLVKPLEAL